MSSELDMNARWMQNFSDAKDPMSTKLLTQQGVARAVVPNRIMAKVVLIPSACEALERVAAATFSSL